jgi:hypothetical protein
MCQRSLRTGATIDVEARTRVTKGVWWHFGHTYRSDTLIALSDVLLGCEWQTSIS